MIGSRESVELGYDRRLGSQKSIKMQNHKKLQFWVVLCGEPLRGCEKWAYRLRERKSERCAIGGVSHLHPFHLLLLVLSKY